MIDVSSIFATNELKQHMSNVPYSEQEKYDILNNLSILQSKLENLSDTSLLPYLAYVDNVIFQINDLDKSLTHESKRKLNDIIKIINQSSK